VLYHQITGTVLIALKASLYYSSTLRYCSMIVRAVEYRSVVVCGVAAHSANRAMSRMQKKNLVTHVGYSTVISGCAQGMALHFTRFNDAVNRMLAARGIENRIVLVSPMNPFDTVGSKDIFITITQVGGQIGKEVVVIPANTSSPVTARPAIFRTVRSYSLEGRYNILLLFGVR
jgi:hypothetical protein